MVLNTQQVPLPELLSRVRERLSQKGNVSDDALASGFANVVANAGGMFFCIIVKQLA
jgi:hypothetical protein